MANRKTKKKLTPSTKTAVISSPAPFPRPPRFTVYQVILAGGAIRTWIGTIGGPAQGDE